MFDQTSSEDTPTIFKQGVHAGCSKLESTNGLLLYSQTRMVGQASCVPNIDNTGNLYNWIGSVTKISSGKEVAENSVCPKGWQMPRGEQYVNQSTYNLLTQYYKVSSNSIIENLPLSYKRIGLYYGGRGSLDYRGKTGEYRTARMYYSIVISNMFTSYGGDGSYEHFGNYFGTGNNVGQSLRCIARICLSLDFYAYP